jgi:hypothetical protein
MLFLRDSNSLKRKEGLGIHPFSRVLIAGEHISLSPESVVYKVTHVHHTGFSSNHTAELYVIDSRLKSDLVFLLAIMNRQRLYNLS